MVVKLIVIDPIGRVVGMALRGDRRRCGEVDILRGRAGTLNKDILLTCAGVVYFPTGTGTACARDIAAYCVNLTRRIGVEYLLVQGCRGEGRIVLCVIDNGSIL